MSKTNDDRTGDSRVDGATQDGLRYVVKFKDGTSAFYRDHDDIASVTARLDEALANGDKPTRLYFSGARAIEGQMEFNDGRPPTDVIGEVRGKGWVWATDVRGIAYTRFDEDAYPAAAYQAATALLESQNQAQADALGAIQEIQRRAMEGAGQPSQAEDANVSLMG